MITLADIVKYVAKLEKRIDTLQQILDADREEYVNHVSNYHGAEPGVDVVDAYDPYTTYSEFMQDELNFTKQALDWYKETNTNLHNEINELKIKLEMKGYNNVNKEEN